ncbi:MAG TPA: PAS domain-containing protein, partial [Rhodospirillales bacterium]|nr:PAS domain-containing protein [Rhodospirillales bacterium]
MDATGTDLGRGLPDMAVGMNTILNTLPHPILVLDGEDGITYANPGAEQFFAMGATQLRRSRLGHLMPYGSPALGLVRESRKNTAVISE